MICPPFLRALLATSFVLLLAGCGRSIEDRLADARAQQEAGLFADSVPTLRSVLEEQPGHAEASYRLGLSLVRTGRPSLAIPYLQRAAGSDEHGAEAGIALAETQLSMRNEEESIRTATAVLEREPGNLDGLSVRARAALALNRPDEVLADAERLAELEPDGYRGRYLRAMALQKLDRLDDAQTVFEELAAQFAEEAPQLALTSCMDLARFLAEGREDVAAAVERATGCLEKQDWNPQGVQAALRMLDDLKHPEEATDLLRRGVEERPEVVALRARLGLRLAEAGETEEAVELLRSAARESGEPKVFTDWGQNLRASDSEAALAAIEEGLEQAYGDLEGLRYMRADILVDLGRIDDAAEAAAAIEEPPLRGHIQGRVLLARGKPAEALAVLERSIASFPGNAGARLAAADAALALGDRDRAMVELREAHRLEPEGNDACLILARLHFARGEWLDAMGFAQRHLHYRGFTGPDAHLIGARAATALGRFPLAFSLLDELGKKEGQSVAATLEILRMERARNGAEAAAKRLERNTLDLADPARIDLVRMLALLWSEAGQPTRARDRIRALVAAHPERPDLRVVEAELLASMGDLAAANAALDAAAARDPGAPGLALARAHLLLAGEEVEPAVALLEPLAEDGSDAAASFLLARIRQQQGRTDDARRLLEELLRRHPEHPAAANDLAWMLAEQGQDLDRALAYAEQAARIQPAAEVFDTLGWVHLKRGENEAAAGEFRRALEQRPDMAGVRYRLGLALEALGEREAAVEAFQTALAGESFPEADATRAAIARLARGEETQ